MSKQDHADITGASTTPGLAKTGQTSDDRQHDFGSAEAVEGAHQKHFDGLRIELAETGMHDTHEMSDAEVADAAVEKGLYTREELEAAGSARHPELAPDNPNPPKGLPTTPVAEMTNEQLIRISHERDMAASAGFDPDHDLVNQAESFSGHIHHERRLESGAVSGLTDGIEDDPTLGDSQLREGVYDASVRQMTGRIDSPLDGDTIIIQEGGTPMSDEERLAAYLTETHGVDAAQLEGRSIEELRNIVTSYEQAEDNSTADMAPEAGALKNDNDHSTATESVVDRPEGLDDEPESTSTSADEAAAEDTEIPDLAPPGSSETSHTIDGWTEVDAGFFDHGTDGNWYDTSTGEVVTDATILDQLAQANIMPVSEAVVTASREDLEANGADASFSVSGENGVEYDSEEETDSSGDDDSADASSDDGSSDEDDDDDDDDGDGDASSSEDDAAATDESEGQTDEESESTSAGGDAGTPHPDGDAPVDPADAARFSDSPFGRAEREAAVDAVDARRGQAGAPSDDPSDAEEAAFMSTPAGAQQLDDLGRGAMDNRNGGDSDPLDFDEEESGGPLDEVRAAGGGVIGPSEDGPTVGTQGGAVDGVPERIGGGVPIAGPVGTREEASAAFGAGDPDASFASQEAFDAAADSDGPTPDDDESDVDGFDQAPMMESELDAAGDLGLIDQVDLDVQVDADLDAGFDLAE